MLMKLCAVRYLSLYFYQCREILKYRLKKKPLLLASLVTCDNVTCHYITHSLWNIPENRQTDILSIFGSILSRTVNLKYLVFWQYLSNSRGPGLVVRQPEERQSRASTFQNNPANLLGKDLLVDQCWLA